MLSLKNKNPIEIATAIRQESHDYKSGHMQIWRNNLMRISNDYEQDMRREDRIFGKSGQRRFIAGTKRRLGLHATIALANPKMHHSISRQVMGAQNFSALPTSHKRNDRFRAQATTQMLKSRLHEHGGQDYETLYKLGLLLKCALPGFVMVEGDRHYPRRKLLNEDKPQFGDVRITALPAWRVHWEPGVEYVEDWAYCMVDQYLSPSQIMQRWPAPDNDEILGDAEIYHAENDEDPLLGLERGVNHSLVRVSQIFIRPNLTYPNGAQWIIIGDRYVKKVYKDNRQDSQKWDTDPGFVEKVVDSVKSAVGVKRSDKLKESEQWIGTPDNSIPIVRYGGLPSSPSTLGLGQMDLVGSLQLIANRKFTAYVEISNTTPDFHVFLPPGSKTERYHNEPVYLDNNNRIGQAGLEIQPRPPLTGLLEEIGWIDGMIDRVMNQPSSARGEIPGTRTSGRTMQASQEFASVTEAPENASFYTATAEVMKRIILEGREVWPDSFVYQAMGETRKLELSEFDKADLASVVDITIDKDDPWPTDKFQRARAIKEYATNGGFGDIVNDPKARQRMEDAMKLPNDEDDIRHNQFQDQMVEQHMQALKKKDDVAISWTCDDDYHIAEEAEYLAEMIAEQDPEATEDYEERVARHIVLHHINANRKDKWASIGEFTEQAEQALQAQTTIDNLTDAEKLALVNMASQEPPIQDQMQQMPAAPMAPMQPPVEGMAL